MPARTRHRSLLRGPLGGLAKVVLGALSFVYLGSVAMAAPLHMLDEGVSGSLVTATTAAAHGHDTPRGHDSPHGPDAPNAPGEHGADCLTCGLLTLPGTEAAASSPAQVPGVTEAVFPHRGLAVSDRAIENPRLRGPPIT